MHIEFLSVKPGGAPKNETVQLQCQHFFRAEPEDDYIREAETRCC
jgi:hypothetical protein